jgi:hypothetical protein
LFEEDLFEGLFVLGFVEVDDGGYGAVDGVVNDFYDLGGASGFEGFFGAREVGRGDLEAVEEQAGALGVEVVGGEAAEDFGDGELDGGAIF